MKYFFTRFSAEGHIRFMLSRCTQLDGSRILFQLLLHSIVFKPILTQHKSLSDWIYLELHKYINIKIFLTRFSAEGHIRFGLGRWTWLDRSRTLFQLLLHNIIGIINFNSVFVNCGSTLPWLNRLMRLVISMPPISMIIISFAFLTIEVYLAQNMSTTNPEFWYTNFFLNILSLFLNGCKLIGFLEK